MAVHRTDGYLELPALFEMYVRIGKKIQRATANEKRGGGGRGGGEKGLNFPANN